MGIFSRKNIIPKPTIHDNNQNIFVGLVNLVYECYLTIPSMKKFVFILIFILMIGISSLSYMGYHIYIYLNNLNNTLTELQDKTNEYDLLISSTIHKSNIDRSSVWISNSGGKITEQDAYIIQNDILASTWVEINKIRAANQLNLLTMNEVTNLFELMISTLSNWNTSNGYRTIGIMRIRYTLTHRQQGISQNDLKEVIKNIRTGCSIWVDYIHQYNGDIHKGTIEYLKNSDIPIEKIKQLVF